MSKIQRKGFSKLATSLASSQPKMRYAPLFENPFLTPTQCWVQRFADGKNLRLIEIKKRLVGDEVRKDLIAHTVVWYRSCLRIGTKSKKNKSDVRGSNRKVRPQKGTGRARVGQNRVHNRRGGGLCHAPKPKNYSYNLAQKIRHFALRSALTVKYNQNQLVIVDHETLDTETGTMNELSNIMFVNDWKKITIADIRPANENLREAIIKHDSPNIKYIDMQKIELNAYHVLDNKTFIITERAIRLLENSIFAVASSKSTKEPLESE